MASKSLTGMLILTGVIATPLLARDPETLAPRQRASDGFIPERLDTSRLHPPPASSPERRRLYERVEGDIDRSNGRIEDEQTYEVRRLQEDRDERLRRIAPRREAERFQEEYDRRLRIEQGERQARMAKEEARQPSKARHESVVVEVEPSAVESRLARFVKEQSQLLETARERYQTDLGTAEAERDEAIRAVGATRQAKALANRRFEERRGELTRAYQAYRRTILGND